MIDSINMCSESGERFCFILGAGASVSSGIPAASKMANQWRKYLLKHEPQTTKKWAKKKNCGNFYSKLYEMRFSAYPFDGYIWLQNAMKGSVPGLGYYHLANILTTDKTTINLVITTNFDSLIEKAIFMYTDKEQTDNRKNTQRLNASP